MYPIGLAVALGISEEGFTSVAATLPVVVANAVASGDLVLKVD
jgi:hypothetical protein